MNPDSAPRLNKWIFIGIDGLLLVIAFAIVYLADNPYAPLPFVSAVVLVAIAAIIGLVPFLTDFAAESADYVRSERARVAEQAQRLQAAAESLTRAAAQIKAVEEAVHKSAREAETLPYRMQEKLAEFNETLTARETEDREALETELEELRAANSERLATLAEKITAAASEWSSLEAATRQQLMAAQAALGKLQSGIAEASRTFDDKTAGALQRMESKLDSAVQEISSAAAARINHAAAPVTASASLPDAEVPPAAAVVEENAMIPAAEPPSEPHPVPVPAIVTEISMSETAPAETVEVPRARKPRAPRKPKPDEILTAMSEEAPVSLAVAEPVPDSVPSEALPMAEPDASVGSAPQNAAESSTSSDGATRLLATAYIGIGNKLYIRGDGPGLSWDAGVPMQFVSIGKWGWSTQDSVNPIRCKLYKNDDVACLTGEILLEPGRHTEVTALF